MMTESQKIAKLPLGLHDRGKAYPCLNCGYDMRRALRRDGRFRCAECGGQWTEPELWAHAYQPYLPVWKLVAWALGMPVLYGVCLMVSVCCGVTTLREISVLDSQIAGGAVKGLYIALSLLLIGLTNWRMAGRWAGRMTRQPLWGECHSGQWFWGTLVGLTLFQTACTYAYPFFGLRAIGVTIDIWWW